MVPGDFAKHMWGGKWREGALMMPDTAFPVHTAKGTIGCTREAWLRNYGAVAREVRFLRPLDVDELAVTRIAIYGRCGSCGRSTSMPRRAGRGRRRARSSPCTCVAAIGLSTSGYGSTMRWSRRR